MSRAISHPDLTEIKAKGAVAVVLLPRERRLIVRAVRELGERERFNKRFARNVAKQIETCGVDVDAGEVFT